MTASCVNVTAVMTVDQVQAGRGALAPNAPAIVSVFAGRIADTGRDPIPHDDRVPAICGPTRRRNCCGPARANCSIFPGRRDRLPHHHRRPTTHRQTRSGRQGSGRVFARDGKDVPQGAVAAGFSIKWLTSQHNVSSMKSAKETHVQRMFSSPAAPAIAAACWCRSSWTRATRSRFTTFCISGDFSSQGQSEAEGDLRAISATSAEVAGACRGQDAFSASPAFPTMRASSSTRSLRTTINLDASSRWSLRPRKPA